MPCRGRRREGGRWVEGEREEGGKWDGRKKLRGSSDENERVYMGEIAYKDE
jgi:hypothetical protein